MLEFIILVKIVLKDCLANKNSIQDGAEWHFIGNVQSRKVKDIINRIDYLHSVDRMSIAKEIQKRADQHN